MAKKKPKIEDKMFGLDFPHLRDGGKWLHLEQKTGKQLSLERLRFYGKQLRELGMLDGDIMCMFADLYWDAVTEYALNKKVAGVVLFPPPPRSLPASN